MTTVKFCSTLIPSWMQDGQTAATRYVRPERMAAAAVRCQRQKFPLAMNRASEAVARRRQAGYETLRRDIQR